MNPNGKVPVLVDHGITMWESGAILIYLAEKYDELMPHVGTKERYEVMKWLMWGSGTLSTEVKQFGFYYKVNTHDLAFLFKIIKFITRRTSTNTSIIISLSCSTAPRPSHTPCSAPRSA
jgi:GST-like protein